MAMVAKETMLLVAYQPSREMFWMIWYLHLSNYTLTTIAWQSKKENGISDSNLTCFIENGISM